MKVAESGTYRFFIPTVVYTGTEYGDWSVVLDSAASLGERLAETPCVVLDTIVLGSPQWWNASCALSAGSLPEVPGSASFCVGCHMYLHAVRVPLARMVGASAIVSGERLLHGEVIKASQSQPALVAFNEVVSAHGIDLLMPLIHVGDGSKIEEMVGDWPESERQMSCVMKGSSREPRCGEEHLDEYLNSYLIPFTRRVLDCLETGGAGPRYSSIARELVAVIKEGQHPESSTHRYRRDG